MKLVKTILCLGTGMVLGHFLIGKPMTETLDMLPVQFAIPIALIIVICLSWIGWAVLRTMKKSDFI